MSTTVTTHTTALLGALSPAVVSYGGGTRPISPGMVVLIIFMGVAAFIFCVSMGLWGRRRDRRNRR